MKKNPIPYYTFLLSILLGPFSHAYSQMNWKAAKNLTESVVVVTDRDVYCVEETVLFKAYNTSADSIKSMEWSKVLYVEIITPDGRAVSQGKYKYDVEGCSGQLQIPSAALTGNYYLRAYTKWMRNFSPYKYYYRPIQLINPRKTDLLQPLYNKLSTSKVVADTLPEYSAIRIKTNQKEFGKRKNVSVKISSDSDFISDLSVAVIKKDLYPVHHRISTKLRKPDFAPEYYPETRGISISGRVINGADSSSIPYNPIHLTMFKDSPEILGATTNKSGRFVISFPDMEGEYEIFITTKNTDDGSKPIILVDNDFCTKIVDLPFVPFIIPELQKDLYNELCFNHQIKQNYLDQITKTGTQTEHKGSAFYGKPEYILNMDEYIALPTLRDYIYELMPNIGIRQKNKSLYLKVMGLHTELNYNDPLILIDLLAIYDVNRILTIPPTKIDHIEIIDVPYIRGDRTYGGIVSFFSREGDLAGIDLPEWGNFIKLKLYSTQTGQDFSLPENKRIPVTRNCLYWNSSLDVKVDTPKQLEFHTGDTKGEYMILLRGIDQEGKIIMKSESFLVGE